MRSIRDNSPTVSNADIAVNALRVEITKLTERVEALETRANATASSRQPRPRSGGGGPLKDNE